MFHHAQPEKEQAGFVLIETEKMRRSVVENLSTPALNRLSRPLRLPEQFDLNFSLHCLQVDFYGFTPQQISRLTSRS